LRSAFDFCAGSGRIVEALRLAAVLWRFWEFRGHLRVAIQPGKRVLEDPASRAHPTEREAALEAAGGLGYWLGDFAATQASYQEAVALARASGDPRRISNALYNLSFLPVWAELEKDVNKRATDADALIDEALALARQVGDRAAVPRCLWARANAISYLRNDVVGALPPLAEAISIF